MRGHGAHARCAGGLDCDGEVLGVWIVALSRIVVGCWRGVFRFRHGIGRTATGSRHLPEASRVKSNAVYIIKKHDHNARGYAEGALSMACIMAGARGEEGQEVRCIWTSQDLNMRRWESPVQGGGS